MKLITFILAITAVACQQKTTPQQEQTSEPQATYGPRMGNTANPRLVNQPAFQKGEQIINSRGQLVGTVSQLAARQAGGSSLLISDKYWSQPFQDERTKRKVVFFSTQRGNELTTKLLDVDISEMKGYALAPIVTYLDKNEYWKGTNFYQHFVYVPTDSTAETHRSRGQTYYIKPKELTFNPNSNLPQFYFNFPKYTLPRGKAAHNLFKITDAKAHLTALDKGNTFINNPLLPQDKQIVYAYDEWLYQSGCPKAYSVSPEEVSKWLARVDANLLLRNFKQYLYDPFKNYGVVVLNWEAMNNGLYGPGVWKIEKCFEFWQNNPHKAKLAIWGYHGLKISRVYIEGNNLGNEIDRALNFKGSLDQYHAATPTTVWQYTPSLEKFVDYHYLGGYLNYPTNYGFVQHFLIENALNQKFLPGKPNLLSWWHNQEYVGDFELGTTYFQSRGRVYRKYLKPVVFPDAMYNAAVWAFTLADGGEIWSEPFPRSDNPTYYGWGGNTVDVAQDRNPADLYGPNSEVWAEQNFQNIDWWEAGKWAISQNKDIIEERGSWRFLPARRAGGSWSDSRTSQPHYSIHAKTPLAAIKQGSNGQLLLVYDGWNDPVKQATIDVNINGRIVPISVKGRYTSVVRIP